MPVNCPIPLAGLCTGCFKNVDDKCAWFFPWRSLREILTPDERIDMLEEKIASFKQLVPSYVLAEIRRDLNNTQGMLAHFQEQFNKHMEPQKRKKLQKATDEKEEGVTVV